MSGRVLEMLRTACVFPMHVASAVQRHGTAFGRSLGRDVAETLGDVGLDDLTFFNQSAVDERVRTLSAHIEACVVRHTGPQVLFEQFGTRNL